MRALLVTLVLLAPVPAWAQLAPPSEAPTRLQPGGYRVDRSIFSLPDHRWFDAGDGGTTITTENGKPTPQAGNLAIIDRPPDQRRQLRDGFAHAFDGDFSHVHLGFQTLVKGADTLGRPDHGYLYTPQTAGIYGVFENHSGWNQRTDGTGGRTGATAVRIRVANYGQGDLAAFNAAGFVSGQRPGATHFLANPAVTLFNGNVSAGSDGVYLNPFELYLNDGGHDVAGIGAVVNLRRSNDTGALGATWMGYRVQSKGPKPVGALFSGAGKARIGLDLADGQYTGERAAITLSPGDRIYMAATRDRPHNRPESQTLGEAWQSFEPDKGWQWTAQGKPVLQATPQATTVPSITLAGGCRILSGKGTPEGAVAAPQCSLYLRADGGPGTTMYVKERGAGDTGWAAK